MGVRVMSIDPCGIDPGDGDITDTAADTNIGWGSDDDEFENN